VLRDAAKGQGDAAAATESEIARTVDTQLGAIARPAKVHFVSALPKTRSGKLLRRAIQAVCEGRDPGDLTTIEDPSALQTLRQTIGAAQR
jgi:propionyl-CoA synthetase